MTLGELITHLDSANPSLTTRNIKVKVDSGGMSRDITNVKAYTDGQGMFLLIEIEEDED